MLISIIIPVYNSSFFLPHLFDSLISQQIEKNTYEVIFVDNNSFDNSALLIKSFINSNAGINGRYLKYSDKQSSYMARNYGVAASNGNILAFTDADCILDRNWLKNIYTFYINNKNQNVIVAGDIKLIIENSQSIWENFDFIGFLNNEQTFKSKHGAATANLIVPKHIFYNVGEFLPIKSGGDFEWSVRAYKTKFFFEFKPDIIIYHPTRKTYSEIRKKFIRIAEGRAERYVLNNENKLKALVVEFIRVFNIKTIINLSRKIMKRIGLVKLVIFIIGFLSLRTQQFIRIFKSLLTKTDE